MGALTTRSPSTTELLIRLGRYLEDALGREVPMRLAGTNFIAAMTLVLAGQAFAVERKPCGPGEQEVMAKDGTAMCVKAYGARPESKGDVAYQGSPAESAPTSPRPK
jgi:hypothetical protein